MRIIAFAASTSTQSINKKLVSHVLQYFQEHDTHLLDLNDFSLPLFSVDLEKKGYPENVHRFLAEIGSCDMLLISLAEHNKNHTAAFKNLFDWCSRVEEKLFQNKPMFLMSTSTGKFGGGNSLKLGLTNFPKFGTTILESFSLPSFKQNFSETEGITDPELKAELEEKVAQVKLLMKGWEDQA